MKFWDQTIKQQTKISFSKSRLMPKVSCIFLYRRMHPKPNTLTEVWNLGVMTENIMKISTPCTDAVKKANRLLGIRREGQENKEFVSSVNRWLTHFLNDTNPGLHISKRRSLIWKRFWGKLEKTRVWITRETLQFLHFGK